MAGAAADPDGTRVQTQDGLVVTVPTAFRTAPELLLLPGLARKFELVFADTSGTDEVPIQLYVLRAPELATDSMVSLELRRDGAVEPAEAPFVATVVEKVRTSLGLSAADILAIRYDAQRGALSLALRHRAS